MAYEETRSITISMDVPGFYAENLYECYAACLLRAGYKNLFVPGKEGVCFSKYGVTVEVSSAGPMVRVFTHDHSSAEIGAIVSELTHVRDAVTTAGMNAVDAMRQMKIGSISVDPISVDEYSNDYAWLEPTPWTYPPYMLERIAMYPITEKVSQFLTKLKENGIDMPLHKPYSGADGIFGGYVYDRMLSVICDTSMGFVSYSVSCYVTLPPCGKAALQSALLACNNMLGYSSEYLNTMK